VQLYHLNDINKVRNFKSNSASR